MLRGLAAAGGGGGGGGVVSRCQLAERVYTVYKVYKVYPNLQNEGIK